MNNKIKILIVEHDAKGLELLPNEIKTGVINFIEMQGGEIWLESEAGKGSTFYNNLRN